MRSIVLGAAMALVVAGSVAAQDAKAMGEQVYGAQKCSICHSIAGKGNPKGSLDAVASKLTPDEIRMWIVDAKAMTAKTKPTRKPEMRQFSLPNEDVDALVAYLASLKK
jgi:mono/diheme cytochrome c family protein